MIPADVEFHNGSSCHSQIASRPHKKTVFTKCKSCKEDGSVLWQIKSKKASHLKDRKIIVYEGVTVETFDIPIAYVPFFYHPDPTVKNKTGLLAPKFTSSNVFGYIYEQPLYLKLRKNSDIVIKPRFVQKLLSITSKENLFKKIRECD